MSCGGVAVWAGRRWCSPPSPREEWTIDGQRIRQYQIQYWDRAPLYLPDSAGPKVGPKLVPTDATHDQIGARYAPQRRPIPRVTWVAASLAVWGSGVRAPQLHQHSSGFACNPRRHLGPPLGSRSRTQAGTVITMSGKERPGPSLPREPGGMQSCYVRFLRERNTPHPRPACVQYRSPSRRAASRAHSRWELMPGEVGRSEPTPPVATRTRCRTAA